jgi:hypothetical protein
MYLSKANLRLVSLALNTPWPSMERASAVHTPLEIEDTDTGTLAAETEIWTNTTIILFKTVSNKVRYHEWCTLEATSLFQAGPAKRRKRKLNCAGLRDTLP